MKTYCKYTLITGASMGLGREFAFACARMGMNLILVSLPGEELPVLARSLSCSYHIHTVYYELDLTRKEALFSLCEGISDHYSVNMIINNAGFGGSRIFESSPLDYLDRMIQLNVRAVSLLTRLMIKELMQQPRAWIMNISSMAAFSPMPFKTLYPASKAFVYYFSLGLAEELKNTRICVSVVLPGPMMTNSEVSGRIRMQGFWGRSCLLSAGHTADISLNDMMKGRKVIVPGFINKINRFLMKWVPLSFRMFLFTRIVKRELASDANQLPVSDLKINFSVNHPVCQKAI